MPARIDELTESQTGQIGELDAVVGEHGMNTTGDGLDQIAKELRGYPRVGPLKEPGKGKLGEVRSMATKK